LAPVTASELADLLGIDEPWRAQAACVGLGSGKFHAPHPDDVAEALAVCASCTVTDECRAYDRRFPSVRGAVCGGKVNGRRARHRAKEPSDPAEVWRRVGAIAAHTG
jgi:hypothetical protein